VASAIWEAWDDAQRPANGAAFLATDSAHSSWFWPHIPADLLEALLCDARATDIPYQSFGDAQWRAFLAALDTAPARATDARAFALAPDFVLLEALESGVESSALFAAVWQRTPDHAGAELVRLLEGADDSELARLAGLLEATPATHFERLSELFAQPSITDLPRAKLAVVRHFLHGYVRWRKPGYADAYARLSEIERQLSLAR
jgi:hypothetical protein